MSDRDDWPPSSSRIRAAYGPDGLVVACGNLMREKMPRLLENLFANLDEALKDLTDKAETEAQRGEFLSAMHLFRRQREAIRSRFLVELARGSAALSPLPSVTSRQDAATHGPNLDGILADEREETLVLSNLVSKAETRYGAELAALRDHLAAQIGRERLDGDSDPFGPMAICEAFHVALEPASGLDRSIRLIVYKVFDKQVMDGLGALYVGCLEIAPDQEPASSAEVARVAAGETGAEPSGSSAGDVVALQSFEAGAPDFRADATEFEYLRRLLERRRTGGHAPSEAMIEETAELLAVLNRLHEQSGSDGEEPNRNALLRRLAELRTRVGIGRGSNLVQVDEDTLDLVFLLFENILRGNDLPDAVKALIARLQIAISKVALGDKSFFDDKHHPARRFLNHLAQSALGWVDDGDRTPDSVYDRIEQAVERVLNDGGRDPYLFSKLDATFARRLAQEREQARTAENRARQELEENERKRTDHALVRHVIDERLQAYAYVPDPVCCLVNDGWEGVMQAALREGGTAGTSWRSARATLDRLLWSVQPKVADEDRRELLRRIPELLRTLRESLAAVSYDQSLLAAKFRELQALHIAALRRPGADAGDFSAKPKESEIQAVNTSAGRPGVGVPMSAAVVQAKRKQPSAADPAIADLRVGTWIEVRRGGEVSRVKLAWSGRESGTHLFVNRRGQKALHLSSEELSALFDEGNAAIVGDSNSPLVDRAMDDLLYFLKSA